MTRKYIVEVNQSADYISAVLRELRWKAQEYGCKDPFLQRVFEKRQYKYVQGSQKSWSFRFDVIGRKHHKGASYTYQDGSLRKVNFLLKRKRNDYDADPESHVIVEIDAPPLTEMTVEILINLIRELEVLEIMQS